MGWGTHPGTPQHPAGFGCVIVAVTPRRSPGPRPWAWGHWSSGSGCLSAPLLQPAPALRRLRDRGKPGSPPACPRPWASSSPSEPGAICRAGESRRRASSQRKRRGQRGCKLLPQQPHITWREEEKEEMGEQEGEEEEVGWRGGVPLEGSWQPPHRCRALGRSSSLAAAAEAQRGRGDLHPSSPGAPLCPHAWCGPVPQLSDCPHRGRVLVPGPRLARVPCPLWLMPGGLCRLALLAPPAGGWALALPVRGV